MPDTLSLALRLAPRFPVFPCAESKRPTCPRGFHAAAQDEPEIRRLWRDHNGPLLGVPMGARSGIDALDIDPRHGGLDWLEEAKDSLPVTRTHTTRSGGLHFLFRHADGVKNSESKIAPGVDTRGDGGYIIYWPAHGCEVLNPQTVAEWPQWLLRILCPPKKTNLPPPPLPATKAEANTRAQIMITRAFDRVKNAGPGQRHYELRAAAATLGGLSRYLDKSESEVQRVLVEMIMGTGASDRANAEKTAKWAMEKGTKSPLMKGAA
jgi:Bifunctional DNA primase/polymerase, N-terminal